MIKVGNIWYPDTEKGKRFAQEIRYIRYKAYITENQKMRRIYRPTGKPAMVKLKWKGNIKYD